MHDVVSRKVLITPTRMDSLAGILCNYHRCNAEVAVSAAHTYRIAAFVTSDRVLTAAC